MSSDTRHPRVRTLSRELDFPAVFLQPMLACLAALRRWLQQRLRRARTTNLADELLRCYRRLPPSARQRLRHLMALAITHPATPAFEPALHFASRVPLPEARQAMLSLLAHPRVGPPDHSHVAPAFHDSRPHLIRALGILRDPSLAELFTRLVDKYASAANFNHHLQPVVHQAAWALCLSQPSALLTSVPWWLQTDPLFLTDLLAQNHQDLPPVMSELLDRLPPARRRLLLRHLWRWRLSQPRRRPAGPLPMAPAQPSRSAAAANPASRSEKSPAPGSSR
jgi:hypothetical protein